MATHLIFLSAAKIVAKGAALVARAFSVRIHAGVSSHI
jgi:hypothetical protein